MCGCRWANRRGRPPPRLRAECHKRGGLRETGHVPTPSPRRSAPRRQLRGNKKSAACDAFGPVVAHNPNDGAPGPTTAPDIQQRTSTAARHFTALCATGARQCLHATNMCVSLPDDIANSIVRRAMRWVHAFKTRDTSEVRTMLRRIVPLQDRGQMQQGRSLGQIKKRKPCAYVRSRASGHPSGRHVRGRRLTTAGAKCRPFLLSALSLLVIKFVNSTIKVPRRGPRATRIGSHRSLIS
jgi:hypothetical protein